MQTGCKYTVTIGIALAITVFVVHIVINALVGGDVTPKGQWTAIAVTALASATCISFVAKALAVGLAACRPFFKLIMGNEYVRGTWGGVIITTDNKRLIFVEHYEQTTLGLVIRGRSFRTAGPEHDASWTTHCASIDASQGKIYCLYETHVENNNRGKADVRYGTGRFEFVDRESSGCAKRMKGVAVDEYHDKHLTYETVKKFDDKLLDFEIARTMVMKEFGPPVG